MKIIGLDPSYKGFGVAIIDTSQKEIRFDLLKSEGTHSYASRLKGASKLVDYLRVKYATDLSGAIVGIEIPPPQGQYAAGLWGLSYLVVKTVQARKPYSIYLFHPTYIAHVFQTRKYPKSAIGRMGVKTLFTFMEYGYKTNERLVRGNLNENKGAAMMFATRLYLRSFPFLDSRLGIVKKYSDEEKEDPDFKSEPPEKFKLADDLMKLGYTSSKEELLTL